MNVTFGPEDRLTPAEVPTMYFVGVTTAQSSIRKVFDAWMAILGRPDVRLVGIDLPVRAEPEAYRRVTQFLRDDRLSLGGLVTTHKVDILRASSDHFDELDSGAETLREISCISKRHGSLRGSAKDPLTSSLALRSFLPAGYWSEHSDAILVCLGAGGSALALASSFSSMPESADRPHRIVVTNRSEKRLEEFRDVYGKLDAAPDCELIHASDTRVNDRVVSQAPPGSVIANATGLGKDAPGSPLTWEVRFPHNAYVWDFNYRGDLVFLEQARAQQESAGLHIEDGWTYFLLGWTQVIADVLDIDIPPAGPVFAELARAAEAVRLG